MLVQRSPGSYWGQIKVMLLLWTARGYGLGCRPRANDIGAGGAIQRGADAGRIVEVTTTVGSIAGRKATGVTDVTLMEPGTWHGGRLTALAIPISVQILVRFGQAAGWGSESSCKGANA